jgi:hypothetical protein
VFLYLVDGIETTVPTINSKYYKAFYSTERLYIYIYILNVTIVVIEIDLRLKSQDYKGLLNVVAHYKLE